MWRTVDEVVVQCHSKNNMLEILRIKFLIPGDNEEFLVVSNMEAEM